MVTVNERLVIVREGTVLLTLNQGEILNMLANGLRTDDIAKLKGRSPQTIKNTRDLIIHKMHAKNAAHAVAIALRNKLIK